MANTYNDPVKQKAREKQREVIRKHFDFKSPSEIKVVCFPGAEVKGEEAIEVREIYDPLGIPRANIVGLEYDPRTAERLRKANLGIEVVEGDAHDFFRTTDKKFDVISLDYKGQRTWKEKDITRYISGRGILEPRGVFSTVHFVKRESEAMKAALTDRAISGVLCTAPQSERIGILSDYAKTINGVWERVKDKKISLEYLRDYGITLDNLIIFYGGLIDLHPELNPFRNNPLMKRLIEHPLDDREKLKRINLPKITETAKGIESNPNWGIGKAALFAFVEKIISELREYGLSERSASDLVGMALNEHNKGYTVKSVERYLYTSNKNSDMLVDIFGMRTLPYGLKQSAHDLVYIDSTTGVPVLNPHRFSRQEFIKKAKKVEEKYDEIALKRVEPPIYLGSSWTPKTRLSRAQALELLSAGYKPAEIASSYSGFSKMQLAAFLAHQTMGKLKEKSD